MMPEPDGRSRPEEKASALLARPVYFQDPDDTISLLEVLNAILRHWRALVTIPPVTAFLVLAVTLMLPRTYTATASFTPESGESPASRLAGLAGQFGIAIPTGEADQSPQFYADLLRSRELLRETAVTSYDVAVDPDGGDADPTQGERLQGDLVALLGIDADTRRLAVARAIETIRGLVSVSTSAETGVVELSVTTRWPALSRQVAERMLELVNRFNLESRRTQAAAERQFIAGQVAEAESALRAAEDSLARFLQQNRRYENSPELRFLADRLERRVTLRQQVFTSLAQSYEQARIEEVRNTPVITVVEPPALPARPDRRRLLLKGVLGLILGGMLATIWAFGRELLATTRETEPDDYAEFARLKRETVEDVRRLGRQIRRMVGRR